MTLLPLIGLAVFPLQTPQTPKAPEVDPMRLKIGAPGEITVQPDTIVATATGKVASIDAIAAAADGKRFVFLGENHDRAKHHQLQADVIAALVKRGRDVVVGFEMFTRPVQDALNPWTMGWWDEATFIERSDWKKQWGFDYALYRPIFEVVKANRLPMVAMNVPRDWVRKVGRAGPGGLAPEEQAQVPPIDLTNKNHRAVFDALMGGHPMTGPQGENIYSGQVLWDTGMADTAIKYLAARPTTANTVFVVVAGSGHVMYNQAINYRIWKRTGERGVNVVMSESSDPTPVSRGIADFVYVSKP